MEAHVRSLYGAALHLDSEVPFDALSDATRDSILLQMSGFRDSVDHVGFVGLARNTGQLLGWLINHRRSRAPALFGSVVRQAHDR